MPKNGHAHLFRDAPDPLYAQLKDSLSEEIAAGRYGSNDRLPSERELSDRFHVSRMTVRQALRELARDGRIYTRIGKGTYIAEPKIEQQLRALTGFTHDVGARGSHPSSRVLQARVIPAPLDVATALQISPLAEVIQLSRLRLSDGQPLAIETAHLPFHLFPELLEHNFANESLYQVLTTQYGVVPVVAEQTLEAALAEPHELELLELTPPSAVVRLQRLTRREDNLPIEFVTSVYRADRYKFRSVLSARSTG